MRRRAVLRAVGAGLVLLVAAGRAPLRADDKTEPAPVDLHRARIRDVATAVSFPIGPDRSVVLRLPERFWIEAPRYLPTPNSLSGDGWIAGYLNFLNNTPSRLYVGVDALPDAVAGETPKAREERAARAFAADLAAKYRRVEFELRTPNVTVATATIKVGGKKTSVWRMNRYDVKPVGEISGPRSVLAGEGVLFVPEGATGLVYVVVDTKGGDGGTTLDRVLADVSVQPTSVVAKTPRVVQLNDMSEAADTSRFPSRLVSWETAPGFVLGPGVVRLPGEWVYAEDRLDAGGETTASLRVRQEMVDPSRTPAQDGAFWHGSFGEKDVGPLLEVPLAQAGHRAYLFSRPAEVSGRPCRCWTAVVRFDDLTLVLDWFSFVPDAEFEKDGAAFRKMLASLQMSVVW
jgi:hypothetical protein